MLGNLIFHYNYNNTVIIKDVFAFSKTPLTIVAFSNISIQNKNSSKLNIAYFWSKIIITIMFLCAIFSFFIDTEMSYKIRYGIKSFKFIYGHPTFMVYALVIMISCLVAHGINKKDIVYHVMGILLLISSFRDKAFIFIILYMIIVFNLQREIRMRLKYIIMFIAISLFVSGQKLIQYLNYTWSPRTGLYKTGLMLVKNLFPIGSGFGTFASVLSGEYYSKIYYEYGFYNRIGTTPDNYIDLGDAGLPYYYGQFGIFGFILFVYIIYLAYVMCLKNNNFHERKALYLLLGYAIIAVFVENFFL